MPLQGDQLSRMTIRGFKSIKNCDISFGKINVLIGSNGAGKSNFISAFSFLQNILSKNLQVSVGQSGLSSLLYNGRKVMQIVHEIRRADARTKGVGNPGTSAGDVMRELLFFILH